MVNIVEQKKELRSFDSKLLDTSGRSLSIDCRVLLPNIWGEQVDITLAIPNSEMPIKNFDNPSKLNSFCEHSGTRLEMSGVHYRYLTKNIVPPRKIGQTEILIAHIDSLYLTEKFTSDENKLFIYISESDFFERCFQSNDKQFNELAEFNCPKLGLIKLQKYGVKASVKNRKQILQSFGYQLEVQFNKNVATIEYILEHIAPTLDLISILLRQRIAVYGWQSFQNNQRARFWKYPLKTTETHYVGVEPKTYLVSFEALREQVNTGIENYQALAPNKKKALYQLSYKLSPAIKLRDEERFMSLFKGVESIASKISCNKEQTPDDKLLIESLKDVAESFENTNPNVSERVKGFIKKISENDSSLSDKFNLLLENENILCSDLWSVNGKKGLTDIRNKLAHKGAVGVNNQGLAVSTLHLALMVERLVFSMLGLTIESDIKNEIHRDEWLNSSYFNVLKTNIFKI